jgi:hypothetical protein
MAGVDRVGSKPFEMALRSVTQLEQRKNTLDTFLMARYIERVSSGREEEGAFVPVPLSRFASLADSFSRNVALVFLRVKNKFETSE